MLQGVSVAVDQAPHLRHGDGSERCDYLLSRCISLWALAFLSKDGLL
jgi:hypothetical protein